MASIRLKFRASTDATKEGSLYYQVIHERVVRQIGTDYRIFADEWDRKTETINGHTTQESRKESLHLIIDRVKWDLQKLQTLNRLLESEQKSYTADELISEFKHSKSQNRTVMEYMHEQVLRLKKLGKYGAARIAKPR